MGLYQATSLEKNPKEKLARKRWESERERERKREREVTQKLQKCRILFGNIVVEATLFPSSASLYYSNANSIENFTLTTHQSLGIMLTARHNPTTLWA